MKATYNNNTTIYIQTMSQSSMKSPNILSTSWRGDNYFSKWVYQGPKHWTRHCTCYSMIMGNIYILNSRNLLFYKAEYMGQSCLNYVLAITFDWSALATWNMHFWTAFWEPFPGIPHLPAFPVALHKAPGTWKFRCQVPAPVWICMCVLRLTALEQEELHCEQLKVFFSVCVSMWFFSVDRSVQE